MSADANRAQKLPPTCLRKLEEEREKLRKGEAQMQRQADRGTAISPRQPLQPTARTGGPGSADMPRAARIVGDSGVPGASQHGAS